MLVNPETPEENAAMLGILVSAVKSFPLMVPAKDKASVLKDTKAVKEWEEGAIKLYVQGDTAMFCFDSFLNEAVEPFK